MELKREQVNALIQAGQKKGFTGKEIIDGLVRKGYQPEGVNVEAIKSTFVPQAPVTEEKPSLGQKLKTSLDTRVERTGDILARQDSSTFEKGAQVFGQGAGLAADVIEKTAGQIPGVSQTLEGMSKGIQWLSQTAPIKALASKIGDSKALQEVVTLYDTDENFKDSVDAVANVARLGGDVAAVEQAVNFTKNVTSKLGQSAKEFRQDLITETATLKPNSARMMDRVARLKPTDATKFKNMTGKTQGEYLTETGNVGAPDEIIQNEATKFAQTLASKDAELAKLPGLYKDSSITEAVKGLIKKAQSESSGGVKAPYLDEAVKLQTKALAEGLSHEEINTLKRLFERNVKVGYAKDITKSSELAKATNIDSALRKFQDNTAKSVGFQNLPELNKQIQTSKFLIDKLGDEIVGKNGLNNVGLTDWIVLSGGDPTAVAGFLTKKFFSSKGVQAKIADIFNTAEIKPTPTPKVKLTPEGIERGVSPTGAKQLTAGISKTVENRVPVSMGGKSTFEPKAKRVFNQSQLEYQKQLPAPSGKPLGYSDSKSIKVAPKAPVGKFDIVGEKGITPSKPTKQPVLKKESGKALPKSSPKTAQKSSLKGKGVIQETNLINEAKKYKSVEEFVKAQGDEILHGTDKKFTTFDKSKIGINEPDSPTKQAFFFTDSLDTAKSYGRNIVKKYGKFEKPLTIDAEGQTYGDFRENLREVMEKAQKEGNDVVIIKNLSDRKDWGNYEPATHYAVIDTNKLLSKSQLEEIWKKANNKK